jgi:AbrB family looped-hinge helix DNA binding protein
MSRIPVTVTLSAKGQLTIPKYIRDGYKLKRGSQVILSIKGDELHFMTVRHRGVK